MNHDLISREALKKALHNFFDGKIIDEPTYILRDVFCYINNAPTVEPCYQTTSCLDCKNYDKENHNCPRYCEVIKEAIKSRPQGEWIKHDFRTCGGLGDWDYKCSNCESVYGGMHNFCPNCGADMRGEKT